MAFPSKVVVQFHNTIVHLPLWEESLFSISAHMPVAGKLHLTLQSTWPIGPPTPLGHPQRRDAPLQKIGDIYLSTSWAPYAMQD